MKHIRVNSHDFAVHDQGSGPPILFVHGFPLNHSMWNAQLGSLANEFRVIAPDLRGFGESEVTTGTVTMETFADDLAGLLDALEIQERCCLCGLSMGGYIAWQFLRKNSDRLSALVLCDTRAVADSAEAVHARKKLAEQVINEGTAIAAESMIPRLFAESTIATQPDVVEAVRRMIVDTDPQGVAAALHGMAIRPDSTELMSTIKIPTLVVVGTEDKLSPPAEMRMMADAIENAEFLEVPSAGHMAPMENHEPVNAAILRLLNDAPLR